VYRRRLWFLFNSLSSAPSIVLIRPHTPLASDLTWHLVTVDVAGGELSNPDFHLPSPISHRQCSPSCLPFGFGFHAYHTNLSHNPSLSFSLRALKFKLQIRVRRTFLSSDIDPQDSNSTSASTLVIRRRREEISLSTLWGGRADVLITADFYNISLLRR